jgi:exodeoxyribonuclease VII small subunit
MSDAKTFKEAYATLQRHAQTLRSQQEPDIDNLTTIVSESVEAYKVCKERIDAVEKALEQALGNAQIEGGAAKDQKGTSTPGDPRDEDDVPLLRLIVRSRFPIEPRLELAPGCITGDGALLRAAPIRRHADWRGPRLGRRRQRRLLCSSSRRCASRSDVQQMTCTTHVASSMKPTPSRSLCPAGTVRR